MAVIALPLCVYEMVRLEYQHHVIAWFVAGVFVILTVPISMFGIFLHLHYWNNPPLQRLVVRILWLVPIYSICCWLALRFKDIAIYLNTGRECYEAWVLYSFTFYLIRSLGTEEEIVEILIQKDEPMHHLFPFCCCPRWRMGHEFLSKCKHGVLSFAVVKTLLAVVSFILEATGHLDEGNLVPSSGYFWVVVINNFSCTWALYCLVQFYHTLADDMDARGMKALPKFLCVKLVLFFSFWQSIFIAVLVKAEVIKQQDDWTSGYDVDSVATGLQDFIICVEMFFAAIWHVYAFSYEEFLTEEGRKHKLTIFQKLKVLLDLSDVRQDVYHHVTHVGGDVVGGAVQIVQAPVAVVKSLAGKIPASRTRQASADEQYMPPRDPRDLRIDDNIGRGFVDPL